MLQWLAQSVARSQTAAAGTRFGIGAVIIGTDGSCCNSVQESKKMSQNDVEEEEMGERGEEKAESEEL